MSVKFKAKMFECKVSLFNTYLTRIFRLGIFNFSVTCRNPGPLYGGLLIIFRRAHFDALRICQACTFPREVCLEIAACFDLDLLAKLNRICLVLVYLVYKYVYTH